MTAVSGTTTRRYPRVTASYMNDALSPPHPTNRVSKSTRNRSLPSVDESPRPGRIAPDLHQAAPPRHEEHHHDRRPQRPHAPSIHDVGLIKVRVRHLVQVLGESCVPVLTVPRSGLHSPAGVVSNTVITVHSHSLLLARTCECAVSRCSVTRWLRTS